MPLIISPVSQDLVSRAGAPQAAHSWTKTYSQQQAEECAEIQAELEPSEDSQLQEGFPPRAGLPAFQHEQGERFSLHFCVTGCTQGVTGEFEQG